MNRKSFLRNSGALLALNALRYNAIQANDIPNKKPFMRPTYLKPGDLIGITSPAGTIKIEEIEPAKQLMESWGFQTKIGDTIGKKDFTFGGTDEERAADLQNMLDDRSIKAIMCARGGYGSVRIIDRINWTKFQQHPKWLIGFSDITVLHNHIHQNCKIATIHSKMCNSFPDDWAKAEPIQIETINSIKDALTGTKMNYQAIANLNNKTGVTKGILIGGNLKTIESLSGSKSDIDTKDKILFVEDTGEYLYSIDRMFWNLKRTGKLSHLKGLIVGGFNIKPDDPGEDFGRTITDIVLEKIRSFNYPVCFDFPVGHQRANFAYKMGIQHKLSVNDKGVTLTESI
jgi:muramoyltetrapeptide carboxypeptidase